MSEFSIDGTRVAPPLSNPNFWEDGYWGVAARHALTNNKLSYAGMPVRTLVRSYSRDKARRELFKLPGVTTEVKPGNLHFFVGCRYGHWQLYANVFGPNVRHTFEVKIFADSGHAVVISYAGQEMDGARNYFNIGTVSELAPPRAAKQKAGSAAGSAALTADDDDDDILVTGEQTFDEVEASKRKRSDDAGETVVIEN